MTLKDQTYGEHVLTCSKPKRWIKPKTLDLFGGKSIIDFIIRGKKQLDVQLLEHLLKWSQRF